MSPTFYNKTQIQNLSRDELLLLWEHSQGRPKTEPLCDRHRNWDWVGSEFAYASEINLCHTW